ncbi:acyl-CoA dehydrogenase domain protein [Shewanella halifaxensis HAW-EB4]|uniref:Acyl-CoA dehydrogenase domain protein n=1 Tax=Shewanella halifaxensis (strain HAW-EB4) TaxID=458817 RepID=B0TTY7_SHEHH|nr:acyl-CoA dehydrogenase family protein [Shewanella halifaxensis]ABZ76705.1 acyl-CoA dehydrogenase domain protein [Shewanella halifaxensis HAW-EB4]
MDFTFTEEQEMIRDTAVSFLADISASNQVRLVMETQTGYDKTLWKKVCEEMFWQGVTVPEAYGGLGLGYVELVALLEKMGERLFCSPFYSTIALAANALLIAGNEQQKKRYFEIILAGATATVAYTGANGRWDAKAVEALCVKENGQYKLNGCYRYVVDGHSANFLIVAARSLGSVGEEGISLFVVDANAEGVQRNWLPTMDQTRKQAEVVFENVIVEPCALLGEFEQGWQNLSIVIDLATIAIAADQVGGAQAALDQSVDYTKQRVQFGRTIASFQAIKHKAADMMLKAEAARSSIYYAACVADQFLNYNGQDVDGMPTQTINPLRKELSEVASIAKAYCSDAYFFNAGCGIQLHGGVGFTQEYDIQLYFKRAKSTETYLGNSAYHRERLANLILKPGALL